MPTLSNGVVVNATGQRDAQGNPVFTDDFGSLYTNQGGRWILSRPGSVNTAGFSNFLNQSGLSDFSPELNRTQQGLTGFTLPAGAYQPNLTADFADQAEEEVGAYFDKELENLNKSISMVKKHKEQIVAFEKESQAKNEQRTFANEDRSFADALQSAQNGFAGRGTSTSGFRNKALEKQDIEREAGLAGVRQGFSEQTQGRELGFGQFLETQDFAQETGQLGITRARNEAIISRQQQIQQQEELKRQAALSAANEGFARFLGSGGVA